MDSFCDRAARPYFADPTANTAVGNVMREEKEAKRKKEMEQKKLLLKDIASVIKDAKAMDCKTVNFYKIPVENLELILAALRAYRV